LGDAVELAEVPDANRASPEAELSNRELREQLELAIGQLNGDRRKAFKLAILERRPYREVAEHTGWSLAKVKITVFRARRQLMSLLADGESDHEAL
jgi:RNA polymerase sigma-70 factor (ECF subfamily)